MSSNSNQAVAVPRMPHFGMRASLTRNPGMSGVTQKSGHFGFITPGTEVRAMTVSTWAMAPLVMYHLVPVSR